MTSSFVPTQMGFGGIIAVVLCQVAGYEREHDICSSIMVMSESKREAGEVWLLGS